MGLPSVMTVKIRSLIFIIFKHFQHPDVNSSVEITVVHDHRELFSLILTCFSHVLSLGSQKSGVHDKIFFSFWLIRTTESKHPIME